MTTQYLEVGAVVFNSKTFTSAIGENFLAGTRFVVIQAGSVNARAQAPNGSLVWIENHRTFATALGY